MGRPRRCWAVMGSTACTRAACTSAARALRARHTVGALVEPAGSGMAASARGVESGRARPDRLGYTPSSSRGVTCDRCTVVESAGGACVGRAED